MSSHEMHTVCAADGTLIAYRRLGSGPALVFVDGAFCTAGMGPGNTLSPPLSELFTTVVYDRRGRGHSGDAPSYAPGREIEDLAAVIDAAGGSAYVFGHSSGAVLALEGAQAGLPIAGMVLYEPPMVVDDSRLPVPMDLPGRIAELAEEGRGRAVVRTFMTEAIRAPKPLALAMSVLPGSGRLGAIAHTVAYDATVMSPYQKGSPLPEGLYASLRTPALVLVGAKSPGWLQTAAAAVAVAIPQGRLTHLDGQRHVVKAKATAPIVAEFLTALPTGESALRSTGAV